MVVVSGVNRSVYVPKVRVPFGPPGGSFLRYNAGDKDCARSRSGREMSLLHGEGGDVDSVRTSGNPLPDVSCVYTVTSFFQFRFDEIGVRPYIVKRTLTPRWREEGCFHRKPRNDGVGMNRRQDPTESTVRSRTTLDVCESR